MATCTYKQCGFENETELAVFDLLINCFFDHSNMEYFHLLILTIGRLFVRNINHYGDWSLEKKLFNELYLDGNKRFNFTVEVGKIEFKVSLG